jgi:hypothetical protein
MYWIKKINTNLTNDKNKLHVHVSISIFFCVCVKDVSCLSPLMPETVKLQKGLNLDHTC